MRISDWSSDVCSSDLERPLLTYSRGLAPDSSVGNIYICRRPLMGFHHYVIRKCAINWPWHRTCLLDGIPSGFASIGGRRQCLDHIAPRPHPDFPIQTRSEEHTSELQAIIRNTYAV